MENIFIVLAQCILYLVLVTINFRLVLAETDANFSFIIHNTVAKRIHCNCALVCMRMIAIKPNPIRCYARSLSLSQAAAAAVSLFFHRA